MLNGMSPVWRISVPSGKTMSVVPSRAAPASSSACSALFCTSKRSTKRVPMPPKKMRATKCSPSSRFATKALRRQGRIDRSTAASR